MASARTSGILTAAAILLLGWQAVLPDADFIYMAASAKVLAGGTMPVTAFYPCGFPALLLGLILTGLHGAQAGLVLSAIGIGIAAGSISWLAASRGLPPAVAVGFGLLAASIPNVFAIGMNAGVTGLFTGLAALFIVLALGKSGSELGWGRAVGLTIVGSLLVSLHWHGWWIVLPVLVLLLIAGRGKARVRALIPLVIALLTLGWLLYGLQVTTGDISRMAVLKHSAGHILRQAGNVEIESGGYGDALSLERAAYTGLAGSSDDPARVFLQQREINFGDAISQNLPQFMLRKAVWLGFVLLILGSIMGRNWPQGAHWLVLLILWLSTLHSMGYFDPRDSALIELLALMLGASGLAVALDWQRLPSKHTKKDSKGPLLRIDPALAGLVVFVGLLAGTAYNGWREAALVRQWQALRNEQVKVTNKAVEIAGDSEKLLGYSVTTGWCKGGDYSLPAAVADSTQFWAGDGMVRLLFEDAMPQLSESAAMAGETDANTVLLWPGYSSREAAKADAYSADERWQEMNSPSVNARIFKWTGS